MRKTNLSKIDWVVNYLKNAEIQEKTHLRNQVGFYALQVLIIRTPILTCQGKG
jgi:hypothetical protein